MEHNTRALLEDVLELLAHAGLEVWVFGGWAEELQGICAPRSHGDIDLLYPAATFEKLDAAVRQSSMMAEIHTKRFPHKRAASYQGVMVEWLLLEPAGASHRTSFFGSRYTFAWPQDTLSCAPLGANPQAKVASRAALQAYRRAFAERERAYRAYLESLARASNFGE